MDDTNRNQSVEYVMYIRLFIPLSLINQICNNLFNWQAGEMLRFYDFYLTKNPLTTKMLTNLGICCTGDMICQAITRAYMNEM